MANYTSKATVGAVTTYTITDTTGSSATAALTANPVTGNTLVLGGALQHGDGMNTMAQLLLNLATGLIP
jgi:hypothetical protein